MKLTRRRLFAGLAGLAAAGAGLCWGRSATAQYYHGPVSDHFDGTYFFDPHGTPPKSFADLLRFWASNNRSRWPEWRPNGPTITPVSLVNGGDCRVTFVGHAMFLIQTAGLNIITDPVWSERASPFTFVGPKRAHDPGIAFDDLPKIDAVIVSHCHYDHLDLKTLSQLAARFDPRVITPLGNDTIMKAHDPAIRAEAYDWGDRVELSRDVALELAPMRHWSARGLSDRNKALWAAFVIETPAGKIYHVGDSGYGTGHHFKTARKKYGPFKLAILPIGAYEPRWFMRDMHMNPPEAVRAFADCGAERALAHHYGMFQLTDEPIDAPVEALGEALAAAQLPQDRFRALKPGQAISV
jgi:L-ascorbate metabolism protein UlaG (beta-lactamase superfamily)